LRHVYRPDLEQRYMAEAERIAEFAEEIKTAIYRVREPVASPEDVWKARFTVSYAGGIADYVYDNLEGARFRAPAGTILPVLIKYGDVAILEGPGVIVRKDKVVEELKRMLEEDRMWLRKTKRKDLKEVYERSIERLTKAIQYLTT
jgi:pyruvate/2-oxoglutarate dehydrogenase complex dihydrolipoamide acyltransferase (E2) component